MFWGSQFYWFIIYDETSMDNEQNDYYAKLASDFCTENLVEKGQMELQRKMPVSMEGTKDHIERFEKSARTN